MATAFRRVGGGALGVSEREWRGAVLVHVAGDGLGDSQRAADDEPGVVQLLDALAAHRA